MRIPVIAVLTVLAFLAPPAHAKGSGSSYSTTSTHSSSAHGTSSHSTTGLHAGSHSKAVPGVHRDAHGKIARDPRQTNAFKKAHPCPSTGKTSGSCPGYVIDHVVPLKRGGADAPSNMQWQTQGAARAKDKWE